MSLADTSAPLLAIFCQFISEKSRIRETKNLLTDADSSTDHKVIHNSIIEQLRARPFND